MYHRFVDKYRIKIKTDLNIGHAKFKSVELHLYENYWSIFNRLLPFKVWATLF